MSTNTPKRPDDTNKNAGTPTQHPQHSSIEQKPAASGMTGSAPQPSGAHPTTDDVKSAMQDRAADLKDQAQGKVSDVKDAAQGKAGDLRDQAQARLDDVRGQAQSAFDDARTQAQDKFSAVTGQAQDTLESVKANLQTRTDTLKETVSGKSDQLAGTVGEKGDLAKQAANEKVTQAGEKLTGFAESLRDKTQTLEPDHPVATAATRAADALEQTGTYLQQSTPDDWMGDLKQLISRKPVESVLVAAGLGYMAARAFRK